MRACRASKLADDGRADQGVEIAPSISGRASAATRRSWRVCSVAKARSPPSNMSRTWRSARLATLQIVQPVLVVAGDGSTDPLEPADVIFVNAGTTRPAETWLNALKECGRLILPLTASFTTEDGHSMSASPGETTVVSGSRVSTRGKKSLAHLAARRPSQGMATSWPVFFLAL